MTERTDDLMTESASADGALNHQASSHQASSHRHLTDDFTRLWAAQTVSRFGSHVTGTALAATAVLLLRATPVQMGLLNAMNDAALLVFGLLAGVWVDRWRRRPVLIAGDLGRAAILAWIPLTAIFGHLAMPQLYIVAALAGILTVFFNVADRSYLPSLVRSEDLVEANSKLGVSDSIAEIAGPSLAGWLVQWLTGPIAIGIDCLTYLFSAACLARIKTVEPPPAVPEERANIVSEITEGLRLVLLHPILRALAGAIATATFFGSFIGTIYWLYLVRELHFSASLVGMSVGAGGIGALLGALAAGPVTRRLGVGRTLLWSFLAWSAFGPIFPFIHAPKAAMIAIVFGMQFLGDLPAAIFFITEASLRQSVIPHGLLGRANATMEFLMRGSAPLGALAAGALGTWIGLRYTWLTAALGILSSAVWLLASPIPALRETPGAE